MRRINISSGRRLGILFLIGVGFFQGLGADASRPIVDPAGPRDTLPESGTKSHRDLPSLSDALRLALASDPWLRANRLEEQALAADADAVAELPDPKVGFSLLNVPADGLALDQEPMTQQMVAVSQVFPPGRSLDLRQQVLENKRRQQPLVRQDRRHRLAATVTGQWLDVYAARTSVALLEQNRKLIEELEDVAISGYSTGLSGAGQGPLLEAQTALARLDARISALRGEEQAALARLEAWWATPGPGGSLGAPATLLKPSLPEIEPRWPALRQARLPEEQLIARVMEHPLIRSLELGIAAGESEAGVAREAYKPEISVNASYAYRQEDRFGEERPDFLSVGVSVSIPLFTANRQDKRVEAAIKRAAAQSEQKWLEVRQMVSQINALHRKLKALEEQAGIYRASILPRAREQIDVALAAYTSDQGRFSDVLNARRSWLDNQVELIQIQVERAKTAANLNYYTALATGTETGLVEEVSYD